MARPIEELRTLLTLLREFNVMAFSEDEDVLTIQLAPSLQPLDGPSVIDERPPGSWKTGYRIDGDINES
jgi:hypothetical protein